MPRGPGAPLVYRDESVLLTLLVAAEWRLSLERITDWLARYDALAEALGYNPFDAADLRHTISLAQYLRRDSIRVPRLPRCVDRCLHCRTLSTPELATSRL